MRDRTVTFGATDLVENFPIFYSKFEEEVPEPKTHTVDIPAGADIDITEALGAVAFHNGKHRFVFLMYSEHINDDLRELKSLIHGKRTEYTLSWDEGYVYTGRWQITELEHMTENSALVTIEVDRYPWKIGTRESVELNAHPTAEYTLTGSERYSNVTLKGTQAATVVVNGITIEVPSGTNTLTGQALGDTPITVTVDNWICYLDGTNLVVNPDYITIADENAEFASPTFELVDTDLQSADEAAQHFTLSYTRKDL